MNFGFWLLSFIKDFVGTPALLVGLFTLIGAISMRKKLSQIIISSFKVTVGFLILGGGAGVLVGSLTKFQPLFERVYNLSGVIPNNDAFAGALAKSLPSIATLGSLIMVVAMLLNIILALFSRLKYVYLSGHVLYYSSLMLAAVMYTSGFDFQNSASDFALALISGAGVLAIYMIVSPAVQQRYMRQITQTDEIALGHTGGFGYALSGIIGETIAKFAKKPLLSTEAIKFPQSLYFFRNTLVSISLTVFVFYLFAFLPAGIMYEIGKIDPLRDAQAFEILSSGNWVVTMIVSAFTFTAGVEIILAGVRLFVGELVPMFKGISDKLIKNSKVAVDCPVVFPYAPNAVIIGFISSFLAGIVGLLITLGLGKAALIPAVILPGLVPHFFLGATSGVFGNVKGGIWGAIVGPFVGGLIITFIPVFFALGNWTPLSNNSLGQLLVASGESSKSLVSLNWGDTDYFIGYLPGLIGLIPKIGKFAIFVTTILAYLGFVIDGIIKKQRSKKLEEQRH
ncbi:Ascorbate-specific PTS system EIIC component [Mesomycoplasma conjunctivae]|uniref:Ascorbate-specific PTS system EIIC component n=1 Tax=Mesomycoplasma conjunctivae (strain ATCC 25834 / NCTC 10147 / HRC/581) TaxID=572263 RepID=C5J5R0_MESCH|nr:PTS ascorbate transporter subunit IIC [Mesomycoplasma conjunctivae]CAT04792.1 Transport protein [Mesomycoplasma conjunctivae]VEU65816.1 Ascorbate-specific PTS system EIIC component [Mesomycoplasma conjunctivae]